MHIESLVCVNKSYVHYGINGSLYELKPKVLFSLKITCSNCYVCICIRACGMLQSQFAHDY